MAFTRKRIEVQFSLATVTDAAGATISQPEFAGGSGNSITLVGYRTSAVVQKTAGAYFLGRLSLRIWGLSMDIMNKLSTLGRTPIYVGRNQVTVSAGDENGVAAIFTGTIQQAFTDIGGSPDAVFVVDAYALYYQSIQAIPPTSYQGAANAADILGSLAQQMGLKFENSGVQVMLQNPYFTGSAMTQVRDIIKAANIEWNNGDDGILAIWPKGQSRGSKVPLISAQTGMIGYPYPSGNGLIGMRMAFNPQITFMGEIQVESLIKPANGRWKVVSVAHEIDAELPGGKWMTSIVGTPPGYLAITR